MSKPYVGMKLEVFAEWPQEGALVLNEQQASFRITPEEVPGVERMLEFVHQWLEPSDLSAGPIGWVVPILQSMRLVRDRAGWRVEMGGWLAAVVEGDGDD